MTCLFHLSTFQYTSVQQEKMRKSVFNAKKQYTVTKHRLSEIDTNLYTVLGHDFYTNTLKSVRYNQYLQALYINISEIIIPRKNPLIMGVFRIQLFAKREKMFPKNVQNIYINLN